MTIDAIFAQVSCRDLAASTEWFATLFGRQPDATPMDHLAEWRRPGAGLQLFEAAEHAGHAGHATLTLIVDDVATERERLAEAGLEPGEVETADYTSIARMRDPDGNLIVLAQPNQR